jgi:hypothetical protein
MALAIVLGAVVLMVIVATMAFWITSQTLFDTQMADQHDVAFQAASSGINIVFTDLRSQLAARPATLTRSGSITASAAVYTAVATLNAAQTSYDCTSTGTSRDGTVETVHATFAITAQSGSSLPWGNNVFYFGGYTGGTIVGNGTMSGPFYVTFPTGGGTYSLDFGSSAGGFIGGPVVVENGNLTIKGTPPAPIEIYTNGTVTLTGNAANNPGMFLNRGWDPSKRIPVTQINASSFEAASLAKATAQSSDNVIGDTATPNYEALPAGSPGTYSALATNPPNNRPANWLRSKAPGAGQPYKVINGNLTINSSTASFGSWSGDGHYPTTNGVHDDFAYDAVNHILYIEGTVYVAGNVTISQAITYVGNGALICTGVATLSGNVIPIAPNGADGTPDPDARHLFCLFSTGTLNVSANVTGAFYCTGQVTVTSNNCTLKGSFIAETGLGSINNGVQIIAVPLIGTYINPGMPVWGSSGSSSLALTIASWNRL